MLDQLLISFSATYVLTYAMHGFLNLGCICIPQSHYVGLQMDSLHSVARSVTIALSNSSVLVLTRPTIPFLSISSMLFFHMIFVFVFQAKQDLNPKLMRRKAVDLFGLYCWRCHNFQHQGLCTCCFLVQEFRGELSPSITTHISVVYVNRHGTSRTRVNPSYARSRSSVENRSFHPTFLLPMTLSLFPLEYLANRSREVLVNL
jgi:hypothetical protein